MEEGKLDKHFMNEALKLAKIAFEKKEVPVGCVIVYNNKIIAKGYNQVEFLKDPTAHAEMIAITSATNYFNDWRIEETTLYTTLEPCLMCIGAIINARIKKIVYAADDVRVGALGSFINILKKKHPIHNPLVVKNILKDESKFLLKQFFKKIRIQNNLINQN